jgi:hypothetical protein
MKQLEYQAVLYCVVTATPKGLSTFLHVQHFTRNKNMFVYNIAQTVRLLCSKYLVYCLVYIFTVWASTISKL